VTHLLDRLRGRQARPPLHPIKLRAIDAAFERGDIRSIADLGAIWAVDGGYTFHALERHRPERSVLVDEDISDAARERAKAFPQLDLVDGNFGDPAVADRVGEVDAVILFDVLLHQVSPDWDEVMRMYAERARYLLVVQAQYVLGNETVRLLDLGQKRYLELVPDFPEAHEVWERMNEYLPERGRTYRDVHNIWQWGMTDADLRRRAGELGLETVYYENAGPWMNSDAFENHAFIFRRT
jgi:hypothetical protein